MFALMLLDRGDLIREYTSFDAAREGLDALVRHEPDLREVAAVVEVDRGRPLGQPFTLHENRRAAAV